MPLVLVADDDDQLRAALTAFLRQHQFQVLEARNGHEALAALAESREIDVIVLDLDMPVMNGWEFLEMRRASTSMARIPTIVLSETSPADPRCRDLPVTVYCAKPFRFEYLAALIDTVLEGGAAQAQRS